MAALWLATRKTRRPPLALTDLLYGGLRVGVMGKIIQIAACGHENTSSTQSNLTLFALCDDGRLWALDGANWSWNEVPLPIPEADKDEPHPHWHSMSEADKDEAIKKAV